MEDVAGTGATGDLLYFPRRFIIHHRRGPPKERLKREERERERERVLISLVDRKDG